MPDKLGPRHRDHPDHDAVYARALSWAIARGWLTSPQITEALNAGEGALRSDRARERVRRREAA